MRDSAQEPGSDSDRARTLKTFPALRAVEAELAIYADLLRKWQARINLVGPATLGQIWWRHFGDSAQLLPFMGDARRCVDLGSGGGFPGLVLALLLKSRAGVEVILVESDSRKAAFLREVSRETHAPVSVLNRRIESPDIPTPDIVTSRALAPVPRLVETVRPWLEQGATGLFLAGESAGGDTDIGNLCVETMPSRTGPGFVVRVAQVN